MHDSNNAYKFWKLKFSKFSRFSRPSKQFFPDNYSLKCKRDITNRLQFRQFSSYLAQLQNILFILSGSIHISNCVTKPNYAIVTETICCPRDTPIIYNKIAFKNVDKQRMLYCNTVTICDNIIFLE